MRQDDFIQLCEEIKVFLSSKEFPQLAIVGHTPLAYEIVGFLNGIGAADRLSGVYDASLNGDSHFIKRLEQLSQDSPNGIVIASDEDKESFIEKALPFINPKTKILFSGYGHFRFSKKEFYSISSSGLVPSFANGYPNSLIHIFQCLENAARRDLEGIVVEFGMFKGGTTMLISRFIEELGKLWKVIGFDTFSGFPPPRSPLDMYAHPDCVFLDENLVRQHFSGRNVEIVGGDIVDTVKRLEGDQIILAFIDTDNFTPASAILDVIQDQIVPGGAIVFDHFTGVDRHKYTLGERIAGKRLLADVRYFHLHGTGVFFRQE